MKSIAQKSIRKQLIKIINKEQIIEVMYEPRYFESPFLPTPGHKSKDVIGSIITIKTSSYPFKN